MDMIMKSYDIWNFIYWIYIENILHLLLSKIEVLGAKRV